MNLRLNFDSRVLIAFILAVLVVAGLATATWKVARDATAAAQWVEHSHEVIKSLVRARADTLEVELATQNFRLSGDASRLADRDAAIASREATLRRIRALTTDNAGQQERWRQLRAVIDERIAISRRIEMLRQSQGREAADAYVAQAPLKQTRERMHGLLQTMEAEERRLLGQRNDEQARTHELVANAGRLVALSLVVLLSGTYLLIRRQLRETDAARTALAEQNERLEQHVRERTARLLESEEKQRLFIYYAPSAIAMFDREMRYVACSRRWLTDYKLGDRDIVGRSHYEVFPDLPGRWKELHRRCLAGAVEKADEDEFPRADGSLDWVRWEMHPWYASDGQIGGIIIFSEVVTARKQAEEKIQALNAELERRVHELEQVSRALRTLSAGNRAMLHGTSEQGLLDSMCAAIVEAGGYPMAAIWYCVHDELRSLRAMAASGSPGGIELLRQLQGSWADNERGRGAVASAIRRGQTTVVRDMLSDPGYGPWRPFLPGLACAVACPLRVDGETIGALSIYAAETDAFGADEIRLLTESGDDLSFGIGVLRARERQRSVEEAMHRLTRHDPLTGLPNETQFTEVLAAAVDAGTNLDQRFAVLQTNVERLTEINDALGFSRGDQLLREFALRLRAAVAEPCVVARLRGDEFAILLPNAGADDPLAMVRRLKEMLSHPFHIADIPLDISARIGIAMFPEHGDTPHDLYRHVDIAVRHAKTKGTGHAVFDPEVNRDPPRRLTMAGELRRAIESDDLVLHLQPKVDMATGRVCGAEGLVRWQHAERGLIPPAEFIGLAEHTGLIKPLTEWVIEAGLRLNQAWACDERTLPIAVNLSARNLRDEELVGNIRQARARYGVAAGLLELEITESTLMEDAEFALRVLHALRDEGMPLFIDDFGTGYSSLSYLQKLPVGYIKIDQSFVRGIPADKDSLLIVRSTIDLVHDLGRKVVAEGVETRAAWDQLAALGCDMAQGYFIARPMPAEEFHGWMERFQPPQAAACPLPGAVPESPPLSAASSARYR